MGLAIPFFAFPEEIRKVIYTTNSIESVNRQIHKIIKNKGCLIPILILRGLHFKVMLRSVYRYVSTDEFCKMLIYNLKWELV